MRLHFPNGARVRDGLNRPTKEYGSQNYYLRGPLFALSLAFMEYIALYPINGIMPDAIMNYRAIVCSAAYPLGIKRLNTFSGLLWIIWSTLTSFRRHISRPFFQSQSNGMVVGNRDKNFARTDLTLYIYLFNCRVPSNNNFSSRTLFAVTEDNLQICFDCSTHYYAIFEDALSQRRRTS